MSIKKPLFGNKRGKQKPETSIVPEGMRGGIFYIRVSTDKQEESGNGLDAQREAILRFAANNNVFQVGDWFTETGSGGATLDKRPILSKAIELAKLHDVYLVTSKLDRLSRKAALVSNMLDDKFKFVTVEHGFQSDDFVIRILAALAQKERELIGERTAAALKQLKRKYEEDYERQVAAGVENPVKKKLGIPSVEDAPKHISHRRRAEGLERSIKYIDEMIQPCIDELMKENKGRKPSRKLIAERMNKKGFKTEYGSEWTESIIYHTLRKIKADNKRQSKRSLPVDEPETPLLTAAPIEAKRAPTPVTETIDESNIEEDKVSEGFEPDIVEEMEGTTGGSSDSSSLDEKNEETIESKSSS